MSFGRYRGITLKQSAIYAAVVALLWALRELWLAIFGR